MRLKPFRTISVYIFGDAWTVWDLFLWNWITVERKIISRNSKAVNSVTNPAAESCKPDFQLRLPRGWWWSSDCASETIWKYEREFISERKDFFFRGIFIMRRHQSQADPTQRHNKSRRMMRTIPLTGPMISSTRSKELAGLDTACGNKKNWNKTVKNL